MSDIHFVSDQQLIRTLLARLGENPEREGLLETPERVIKAWKFWTSGYSQDPKDVVKSFEDGGEHYDQMLFQSGIPVYTHCEHHMAGVFGVASIAYIPNGRIIGLSKLSRLVDIFAHRLQVQERLTQQIAKSLMEILQPKGVGVTLMLRHLCMESRGVQKVGTITESTALYGCIKDEDSCRAEFLSRVPTASSIKI